MVLDHVLPSDVNMGYHAVGDRRIVEVDDQKVNNLAELVRLVEAGAEKQFVVFKDDRDELIVLDRQQVELESGNILKDYGRSRGPVGGFAVKRAPLESVTDTSAVRMANASSWERALWLVRPSSVTEVKIHVSLRMIPT